MSLEAGYEGNDFTFEKCITTIIGSEGPLTTPDLLKKINDMGEWTGQKTTDVGLIQTLHGMYYNRNIERIQFEDGKHGWEIEIVIE